MDGNKIAEFSLAVVDGRPDVVLARGEGIYVYDRDGKCYADLMSAWGCNVLGMNFSTVTEAIREQAGRLIHSGPLFFNDRLFSFAEKLLSALGMDKVFFTSTGTEANENALKLARKYGSLRRGGAHEVITFSGGFHGRSFAMMSAADKPAWKDLFEPKLPGFIHLPWGDMDALRKTLAERGEKVAAVMLEPIQGEGGVNVPANTFLRELRELTAQEGILMIVDEVQTGMSRTGKLLAIEHSGVQADIVTLGKALGGGFPLGAVLAKKEIALLESGEIGGTYNGHALGMAVAEAVFAEISVPSFLDQVSAMGRLFRERLAAVSEAEDLGFANFRGAGLMIGWDVRGDTAGKIAEAALRLAPKAGEENLAKDHPQHGLILNAVRPGSIRILPPCIINETEVENCVRLIARATQHVLKESMQQTVSK